MHPSLFSSPPLPVPSLPPLVICQPTDLPSLVRLNEMCRAHGISFFYAYTGGVHGAVFVDHGDNHRVFDFNGMRARVIMKKFFFHGLAISSFIMKQINL